MEINLNQTVSDLVKQVTFEAKSRAFRAANELRNAELQVLRGQRSGRVYKRPHSSSTYTASAPGEAPAVRSGDLRRSFRPIAESQATGKTVAINPAIRTEVKYAPYLDDGTDNGHIAPRPYKEPVIEKAKPRVIAIYSEPYLK